MLAVTYNPLLLFGAAVLAMMAGFTGLSLTNGLSQLSAAARKPAIVRAATVLGGGVWATHFVAMLALRLPVEVVYDPVYTLTSALLAILMAGSGLLVLHFAPRSPGSMALAGGIMGLGVVMMHYVGMFGMRGCAPVFGVWGYVWSTVLSVVISIGAIRLAYARRRLSGLVLGGAVYGLAILTMHFSAMSQTGFMALDPLGPTTRLVPNDMLALLVVFVAFLICGAFLLTTVTVRPNRIVSESIVSEAGAVTRPDAVPEPPAMSPTSPPTMRPSMHPASAARADATPPPAAPLRVPYELDGVTFFAPVEDIVAIQADGHYTRLHRPGDQVFCPIAINRLAEDLKGGPFLRTHRSYLVNTTYVAGFERRKDQGRCLFHPELGIDPAPVSRANIAATRAALQL